MQKFLSYTIWVFYGMFFTFPLYYAIHIYLRVLLFVSTNVYIFPTLHTSLRYVGESREF